MFPSSSRRNEEQSMCNRRLRAWSCLAYQRRRRLYKLLMFSDWGPKLRQQGAKSLQRKICSLALFLHGRCMPFLLFWRFGGVLGASRVQTHSYQAITLFEGVLGDPGRPCEGLDKTEGSGSQSWGLNIRVIPEVMNIEFWRCSVKQMGLGL